MTRRSTRTPCNTSWESAGVHANFCISEVCPFCIHVYIQYIYIYLYIWVCVLSLVCGDLGKSRVNASGQKTTDLQTAGKETCGVGEGGKLKNKIKNKISGHSAMEDEDEEEEGKCLTSTSLTPLFSSLASFYTRSNKSWHSSRFSAGSLFRKNPPSAIKYWNILVVFTCFGHISIRYWYPTFTRMQ